MTAPAILLLGQDIATVDFTSPAIPPGMTAETVMAGLHAALRSLEAQGYAADLLQVLPDLAAAETAIAAQLATRDYAVVVIGAGLRTPPPSLLLFEVILNAVHRHAPRARIAFNTRPEDSDAAAVRWVER